VTVGARKLVDILRALPEDAEVTLQQQDKRLLVKAGKSRFTLQTLPAEDFRACKARRRSRAFRAQPEGAAQAAWSRAIRVAQQDIRYYLNGLLVWSRIGN